jgi:hypothetical protein
MYLHEFGGSRLLRHIEYCTYVRNTRRYFHKERNLIVREYEDSNCDLYKLFDLPNFTYGLFNYTFLVDRYSSVSIATCYGLDGSGLEPQ